MALRFLTAGESHGPALTGIVEGMPAGVPLSAADLDRDLARRQQGHGRGGRMRIEHDRAEITGGVRRGRTLGSPVSFLIRNRDFAHWQESMAVEAGERDPEPLVRPRPGHADLAGGLKYGVRDLRDILERSSARETAARVAAGAVAKVLLRELGIQVQSHVLAIGGETAPERDLPPGELRALAEASPVRCADPEAGQRMVAAIDEARAAGDSLGGVFEVVAAGVPPGLGSHVQWDRKLDGRIAGAFGSIPGIKGVEQGLGFRAAALRGSQVHDPIYYDPTRGFFRRSNRAGGLEGGVTNGEPVVVRAAMKPIPTLRVPLPSVDIRTGEALEAAFERSDVCAVPAAAVVGEAMLAWVLAEALLEKTGGDSLGEVRSNLERYRAGIRELIR